MSSQPATDAPFLDALSGANGMGDPPPAPLNTEVFPDALVAPQEEFSARIEMPEVPVPELPTPQELLAAAEAEFSRSDDEGVGRYASSAERAKAARQAMAARRDAAVGQRLESSSASPGIAPAPAPGQAPTRVAASGHGRMPAVYPHGGPPPGARQQWAPPSSPPMSQSSPSADWSSPPAGQWPAPHPAARPQSGPGTHPAVHPQSGPGAHPAVRPHPGAARPRPAARKKSSRSGGAMGCLVFIVIFLVASGLGKELLDALSGLLNQ